MSKCPLCHGYGKCDDENYAYLAYHDRMFRCNFCKGTGKISMKEYMEYVRAHRRIENRGVRANG